MINWPFQSKKSETVWYVIGVLITKLTEPFYMATWRYQILFSGSKVFHLMATITRKNIFQHSKINFFNLRVAMSYPLWTDCLTWSIERFRTVFTCKRSLLRVGHNVSPQFTWSRKCLWTVRTLMWLLSGMNVSVSLQRYCGGKTLVTMFTVVRTFPYNEV